MKKLKFKIILVISITAISYICSAYWYQLMLIRGNSMYPTYRNMQLTILEKSPDAIRAGDVIAFRCEGIQTLLVKRVVALPGQSVWIKDGMLYIDGRLDAHALSRGYIQDAGLAGTRLTLSGGEYFVLGDNYASSRDSRHTEIGCVKYQNINGRVWPHKK